MKRQGSKPEGPRRRRRLGAQHESPARQRATPSSSAWQEHMLAFDGETLNEAIAEVSRQTGWRFELADPQLGDSPVGGYVRADPEAFMELMSSSLDLEAHRPVIAMSSSAAGPNHRIRN